MEPDNYEIEDNQPIPGPSPGESEELGSKPRTQKLDAPLTAKDLTPPNSQAPNPHKSNGHFSAESGVSNYFNLYKWHPFTELFCLIAEWFEPEVNDIDQRQAFARKHPGYFKFAVLADFMLLVSVVLGILAAIVYVALRAIGVDFEIEVIRIPIPWPRFGNPDS